MADMHVLTGTTRRYRVIMHFAIPNSNNDVGVNYRTALVNSGIGGTTELIEGTGVGEITTAEKALVASGEVFEHSVSIYADGTDQTAGGRPQIFLRPPASRLRTSSRPVSSTGEFLAHIEETEVRFLHRVPIFAAVAQFW